ncbi:MAG: hypothetical protein ABIQ27_01850 [Flavobacterium sp.]|uniref:hypothetical protein n=1 Tax=Flavobacterium sp. TaxID=239 RepID=UPI003265EEB1
MKNIYFLIVVLVSGFSFAQNTNDYERVYVEAGFVQPIGKLANQFDMSPSFGFWFRNRLVKTDFIDFGFNFFIPKNPAIVNVNYQDSIIQYKSKHFGINIGSRFAKVIPMSLKNNNCNVEWNSGIGIAINVYKAPEEIHFEGDEHSEEVFSTFYISQGIKFNYKNIGLQCHYQFSPYGLFNQRIDNDYGSQSLMFGIVYRQ